MMAEVEIRVMGLALLDERPGAKERQTASRSQQAADSLWIL